VSFTVHEKKSQEAFQTIAQWNQEHPNATMAEIESAIDQQLDEVGARIIEEIAQTSFSSSVQSAPVCCPQCRARMHQRGKHARHLKTRGDLEVTLERDYLSCPDCGYSFFPPR
jgi:hypothetical protein